MDSDPGKPEATEHDPEGLLRLLDLELRQKRVQWQQAAARHRSSRMMWLFSIIIVIVAAIVALFFLFSQANEGRTKPLNSAISDNPDR
ncbi:MAG: hypothetical protein QOI96_408 [Verrucomicrobiota bacterium]|jgi:uncharacterized membrane protein